MDREGEEIIIKEDIATVIITVLVPAPPIPFQ
jgi:hypothetical protein